MTDDEIKTYIQDQINAAVVDTPWTEDNLLIAKLVFEKAIADLVSQSEGPLPTSTTLSVDGNGNLVYNWAY